MAVLSRCHPDKRVSFTVSQMIRSAVSEHGLNTHVYDRTAYRRKPERRNKT